MGVNKYKIAQWGVINYERMILKNSIILLIYTLKYAQWVDDVKGLVERKHNKWLNFNKINRWNYSQLF